MLKFLKWLFSGAPTNFLPTTNMQVGMPTVKPSKIKLSCLAETIKFDILNHEWEVCYRDTTFLNRGICFYKSKNTNYTLELRTWSGNYEGYYKLTISEIRKLLNKDEQIYLGNLFMEIYKEKELKARVEAERLELEKQTNLAKTLFPECFKDPIKE